jgi:hypothetical protein
VLTPLIILAVIGAGAVAGCLGALLGIGGGVFLVPFLNAGLGLPFNIAAGIGLMTVIATSSVVSTGSANRGLVNLRVGMLLQVFAGAGGLIGGITVVYMPRTWLYVMFSAVTALIAMVMIARLDARNTSDDIAMDVGRFGGRYVEPETRREVVYRIKRLPVAILVSLGAGSVSGLLGIGGGVLQVPALNAWCGMPMRAAAATSAVMIGVTAVASAPLYYARGDVAPPAAAAAVIGVLIGSRLGFWFGGRARARWLKMLMAGVLAAVSVIYLLKAL